MSFEQKGPDISLVAGADLSTKQYFAVKVNSSGQAVLAGAGEAAIGILQNNPASGQVATVRTAYTTKAAAGGTIAAGARVASDANGKMVVATAGRTNTSDAGASADALIGSNVIGTALEGGADGEIIAVLIQHAGSIPTTAA